MSFVEPTRDAMVAFVREGRRGPIVMLNLLRFRDVADYSAFPELAPEQPISGFDAYERYIEHTLPFLLAAGGEVVFRGKGGNCVIGPRDERWDSVLLVRHRSVQAFLDFANDPAYLAGLGHRTAALADSRLVPIELEKP
jgi:uncharacterized protein (DUF1330 family)